MTIAQWAVYGAGVALLMQFVRFCCVCFSKRAVMQYGPGNVLMWGCVGLAGGALAGLLWNW